MAQKAQPIKHKKPCHSVFYFFKSHILACKSFLNRLLAILKEPDTFAFISRATETLEYWISHKPQTFYIKNFKYIHIQLAFILINAEDFFFSYGT